MTDLQVEAAWPRQAFLLLSYLASGKLAAALGNAIETWEMFGQLRDRIEYHGVYEILEYDGKLELQDRRGKTAVVTRHEKIRILQNNVVAIVDHAWGTGDQFAEYDCQPGIPVDFYDDGAMQSVLLSLREIKNRGDSLDLWIHRVIKGGFEDKQGWLETEIDHQMKHLRWSIIFPRDRHCQKATVSRRHNNRTVVLGGEHFSFLSDGRQELIWETSHPRLHDRYIIKWDW